MRAREFIFNKKEEGIPLLRLAKRYDSSYDTINRILKGIHSRAFCKRVFEKDGISLDGYSKNERMQNLRFYCDDDVLNEFLDFCKKRYGRVCTEAFKDLLKAKNA